MHNLNENYWISEIAHAILAIWGFGKLKDSNKHKTCIQQSQQRVSTLILGNFFFFQLVFSIEKWFGEVRRWSRPSYKTVRKL